MINEKKNPSYILFIKLKSIFFKYEGQKSFISRMNISHYVTTVKKKQPNNNFEGIFIETYNYLKSICHHAHFSAFMFFFFPIPQNITDHGDVLINDGEKAFCKRQYMYILGKIIKKSYFYKNARLSFHIMQVSP